MDKNHYIEPAGLSFAQSQGLTAAGGSSSMRRAKAVFTQRSLSDLTLDRSKFMSDKVCLNTLNRIGKPKKRRLGKSDNGSTRLISLCERCSFLTSIPDGSTETIADLAPNVIYALPHMHKCHKDLDKH